MKGKVIVYMSAGQVSDSFNIKKKRSYFLVNYMMSSIIYKLKENHIKKIRLILKSNISRHMYKVVQILKSNGFFFDCIKFLKPLPHHFGQRRKKLRRL